jgi:hypothetical protein
MKSTLNTLQDVKTGKLTAEKALAKLKKIPGGEQTQTYRRIKRLVK